MRYTSKRKEKKLNGSLSWPVKRDRVEVEVEVKGRNGTRYDLVSHGNGKHLCVYWSPTCKVSLVCWKLSKPPADYPTEWLRAPHQISEASSIIERSQIIHKAVAYVQHPSSRRALL
ncbi:hypothetical protein NQZ68_010338 [Dissostichus eleginoides]|nr:hypothetical protein NQZ68_010338 [Dissostichus eleginoides]